MSATSKKIKTPAPTCAPAAETPPADMTAGDSLGAALESAASSADMSEAGASGAIVSNASVSNDNDVTKVPRIGGIILESVVHLPEIVQTASWSEGHELRKKSVGASESAALFTAVTSNYPLDEDHAEDDQQYQDENGEAVSPYITPYALFALKSGRLKEEFSDSSTIPWAKLLKPMIIERICHARNWVQAKPNLFCIHPTVARMSATVTYAIDTEGLGVFVPAEVRAIAGAQRWKWFNGAGEFVIPGSVMIELQHRLAVTGCQRLIFMALVGGAAEQIRIVERDEELIAEIEAAVAEFWEHVDRGEAPEPDYKRDARTIKRLNSMIDPDKVLDWRHNNEAHALIAKKKHHQAIIKANADEVDLVNARIDEMMGDASAALLGERELVKSVVAGGEVKYFRKPSTRLTDRKVPKKHAGSSLSALVKAPE